MRLLVVFVCFLSPTVEICLPSTLWIDSSNATPIVSSKVIPPDVCCIPHSKTIQIDGKCSVRISENVNIAHIDWPEFTPFGINLVFCSCKKHQGKNLSNCEENSEPTNMLWRGSKNILCLSTPQKWRRAIDWRSLWTNHSQNCGCAIAKVTSYVGNSSSEEILSAHFTSTLTGKTGDYGNSSSEEILSAHLKSDYVARSSVIIRPVSVTPKMVVSEHAQKIGNSPSCQTTKNHRKNEWVTIWGISNFKKNPTRNNTADCPSPPRFLIFYSSYEWKLEPMSEVSKVHFFPNGVKKDRMRQCFNVSIFDFLDKGNTLFCLAVWVGSSPLEPVDKYRLVLWKDWQIGKSAPIIVLRWYNWIGTRRRNTFRSSSEFRMDIMNELRKEWDGGVTYIYGIYGLSSSLLLFLLLITLLVIAGKAMVCSRQRIYH